MKYIDADRLRAEIERRKKENMYVDLPMSIGRYYEDRDLLAFLDTLEEPISEDLEEELDRFIASGESVTVDDYGTYKVSYHDFKKVARHFAEWQKAKMMNDAVEGEVVKTNKHTSVRYKSYYGTDRYFYGIADKQFKAGDKVKIIIVKEDGE